MMNINITTHVEFKNSNENYTASIFERNTDGKEVWKYKLIKTKFLDEAVDEINIFLESNDHKHYSFFLDLKLKYADVRSDYVYHYIETEKGALVSKEGNLTKAEFTHILNRIFRKKGVLERFD